ncbi:MAG TPA: type Z 30S ribosomal protein S14 [Limnochordia bacterium]
MASKARRSAIGDPRREPKFATRRVNRCRLCGRPRAYMRDFQMCRICFRTLAHRGEIPGVTKASW